MISPNLQGRHRELGVLRTLYDRSEPSLGWVVGPAGIGKTALVERASADFHQVYHRAPPLSEPQQLRAFADTLAEHGLHPDGAGETEGVSGWDRLLDRVVSGAPAGRPTVVVIDDAHRWHEARARYLPALARSLARARAEGLGIHVTLVAPEAPSRTRDLADLPVVPDVALGPLPFRAARDLLPGSTAADLLRAYGVFGGTPRVLSLLDRGATLGTNVRRLVLGADAPLADAPLHLLERVFQTPTRYAAILAALAPGEGDWGVVRAGVPDLSASGQAAPYLKRLEEVGLVEARRSLDASPRARNRRYRIVDPFTAFWFRFLLPHRHVVARGGGDALYAQVIRPGLEAHVASVLPQVCRGYMEHDALERLGAGARECGSLWGSGYDIPVAGVLSNGAAFYGAHVAAGADAGSMIESLDARIRETRYGFGRERRVRVVFLEGPPAPQLQREAARRDDTVLLDHEDLAGIRE